MKWLEIIRLRGSGNVRELFNPEMTGVIEQIGRLPGLAEIRLYYHAVISNEVAIHLLWETQPADLRGSPIGQRLAQILKEFGLTNHNLWEEEEPK